MTVRIKIDCATAFVDVYVGRDSSQMVPLIVGQSCTEQAHIVLIKRGDAVRIYDENEQQNFGHKEVPELPPKAVSLWAKDAVVIPENNEGMIDAQTTNKMQDLFIDV